MSGAKGWYGGAVLAASFLLFLCEPMAAKQLLPVFGGSSAVWMVCLVFFQAALLVGYGYAHWMSRGAGARLWVHVGLMAGAVAAAGVWAFGGMGVVAWGGPMVRIFVALAGSVGLPFCLLGATTPLLQVWFARTERRAVPYGLFALSNAGSLLGLAAYPLLVEPRLTLAMQRVDWAIGFAVFAGMCGWLGWRSGLAVGIHPVVHDGAAKEGAPELHRHEAGGTKRWMWFLLPMGAAMQLSAVTSHLSQDIAAIPLLWILPLATYLVTFILAFEAPGLYRRWLVGRLLAVMLASLAYSLSKLDARLPVGMAVLFFLVEIFVACWFCHAEVYRLRPARAEQSTVFYLLIAAGGVTGTFLSGIASPLIFRANYDLAIAFLVTAVLATVVTWQDGWGQRLLWATGSVLLFGLTILLHIEFERGALMTARNFYGSLRVTASDFDDQGDRRAKNADGSAFTGTGPVRVLMNGRIRHGMQMMERRNIPTTYYGFDSGVGVALRNCCEGRTKKVGVIGLGAGTLAAYGVAGDTMRFYEINPLVLPIAWNLFTYMRDSRAAISVVEGDGRAVLSREAPHGFDVLVVDAFSGDAIPLHLLTREAMEVYRQQLAPDGVIAFHVSNSYLDLAPEVALLADAEGMQARVVKSTEVPAEGAYRATWVLVSDAGFFARPGVSGVALPIRRRAGLRLWTDDYSSLLPVLRLGH